MVKITLTQLQLRVLQAIYTHSGGDPDFLAMGLGISKRTFCWVASKLYGKGLCYRDTTDVHYKVTWHTTHEGCVVLEMDAQEV
jgi:DNA-binding IclR family transcriptional regulator